MSRRSHSVVASLLLASPLVTLHAGAQMREIPARLRWDATANSPALSPLAVAPRFPMPSVAREEETEHWGLGRSVGGAVLGMGGGALLGGWLGYFVSQVGRSDWEKLPSAEKTQLRKRYAISGASAGAVVGYFLRPRPRTITGGARQPLGVPPRVGRQLIASGDLRRTVATNALEVVELDRPEWIKALHDDAARRATSDTTSPVESRSVVVYVGEERVGSIESLRDIAVPEIVELRFYDARDARRRWGSEHRYGAIEVVPASAPVGDASNPAAAARP